MLARLLGLILGYCVIHIRGRGGERFINFAMENGINIWDISWLDNNIIEAKIEYGHVHLLPAIRSATKVPYKIKLKRGLPVFSMYLIKRRLALLIGGITAFIIIFWLSGYAYFIEIIPDEPLNLVTEEAILAELESAGISLFTSFSTMDFANAEYSLLVNQPLISFVNIKREGTKIIVSVVEKTNMLENITGDDLGSVWAGKDGVIEKVLILYGEAAVESGDTVAKGDLLVTPLDDGKSSAIVQAKVWYQGYGECVVSGESSEVAGEVIRTLTLALENKETGFLFSKKIDETDFEYIKIDEDITPIYLWQGIRLPINIIEEYYLPYATTNVDNGQAEAIEIATEKAVNDILSKLPDEYMILEESIEIISQTDDLVRVKVEYICLEDIAVKNNIE